MEKKKKTDNQWPKHSSWDDRKTMTSNSKKDNEGSNRDKSRN